jgi:hypothetical protein
MSSASSAYTPVSTILAFGAQGRVRSSHESLRRDRGEAVGTDPIFALFNSGKGFVDLLKLGSHVYPEIGKKIVVAVLPVSQVGLKTLPESNQHLFHVGRSWCAHWAVRASS